ncbi:MAG: hypothetical protein JXB10_02680 [Pirellulales bacterium]|nr:hypothetical protein [Pirellulales bacterium]
MNDELPNLERRLEQATAPLCPEEALNDPQLAAWREGWLALEQLLESIEPPADWRPVQRVLPANISRAPRGASVVSALIAASLLVGLTVFGLYHTENSLSETGLGRHPIVQQHTPQNIPEETDLRWDDNWDEKLSALSTRLALVQGDGDVWTADYLNLRSRANALQQELENNAL